MQRNVRDECFSAFDDRSVAQHKNFTASIDKTKGKIAFQKNQIPCERSAAVFKCKGKRDLQKTSFLFKVQDDSSLHAECEKTSCKMLLPLRRSARIFVKSDRGKGLFKRVGML